MAKSREQEILEQLIHDARINMKVNLNPINESKYQYWSGYASGLLQLQRECLEAQRDAWDEHTERRIGA